MFKKSEHKKRGTFLPFVIFRLCLSLTILAILALGVYQAFRYFSGMDPLKIDPKTAVISILTSENTAQAISDVLGFEFPKDGILPQDIVQDQPNPGISELKKNNPSSSGQISLKFALMGDSHNDNETLKRALNQARAEGVKFVIGMGDYSDTGTSEELRKAKAVFDTVGLPYYTVAGDHDLWDARDKGLGASARFESVFGPTYRSFIDSNIRFILLYNSDNYDGVDSIQRRWLEGILQPVSEEKNVLQSFVFLHEPLYHPSSERVMGKVTPKLAQQAEELISLFKSGGVSEIFSGDVHSYARFEEPTGLKMTTVGAVTSTRNLQLPRFILVDVYDDGSYNISDTEIR